MTEEEARSWVEARFDVPRETMERLDLLVALLREESERQNLVSRASLDAVWSRHVADSAQLLDHAPSRQASWVDLGTGAGFPGLVVAALHGGPVTLIEERRLRADFLRRTADAMGLLITLHQARAERVKAGPFDVISARAFAPLPRLLDMATALSTTNTVWLLPKGRGAQSELEALDPSWQGSFRLEPSATDPQAHIVVAEGVRRRSKA